MRKNSSIVSILAIGMVVIASVLGGVTTIIAEDEVDTSPAPNAADGSQEGAPDSRAAFTPGMYKVKASSVYVRTHASGLILGTLYNGHGMYISHRSGAWGWGHAFGNVNQAGWVLMQGDQGNYFQYVRSGGRPSGLTGPRDIRTERRLAYVDGSHQMLDSSSNPAAYSTYSFSARVKPRTSLSLYGNVRGNAPRDRRATLRAGTEVGVRYYPDRRYPWVVVQLKSSQPGGTGKAEWLIANLNGLNLTRPAAWYFLNTPNARNPCESRFQIKLSGGCYSR
jgi:hypothetical protein